MIKFVDLFSGIGGIRLGFQQALQKRGISSVCVKSSEIDKYACETYSSNFQENSYTDVKDIEEVEAFDVLLAGFPCQSFSYAGKQLGFADTRGTLFFEIERLLKKYRPKLCFLENVRGLTTHDNGRTFRTIIHSLEDIGYKIEFRLLNSSNYGIPQNRVRIYIVASLDAKPKITLPSDVGSSDSHSFIAYSQSLDLFNNKAVSVVRDILEDNPGSKYDCSPWFTDRLSQIVGGNLKKLNGVRLIDTRHGNSIHSWDIGIKGACNIQEINFMNLLISNRRRHIFGTHQDGKALTLEQIQHFYTKPDIHDVIDGLLDKGYLREENGRYNPVCGNMSFEVFKFLDPDSISITLTASDSHKLGVYHNHRLRRLTPRECARLQGFPDSFTLHPNDTYAYRQIGNAVSVPVIEQLFSNYFQNNTISLFSD